MEIKEGSLVKIKLTSDIGMVVNMHPSGIEPIRVRMKDYSIKDFQKFELEKYDPEKEVNHGKS